MRTKCLSRYRIKEILSLSRDAPHLFYFLSGVVQSFLVILFFGALRSFELEIRCSYVLSRGFLIPVVARPAVKFAGSLQKVKEYPNAISRLTESLF